MDPGEHLLQVDGFPGALKGHRKGATASMQDKSNNGGIVTEKLIPLLLETTAYCVCSLDLIKMG
jgi:hypothetical protein